MVLHNSEALLIVGRQNDLLIADVHYAAMARRTSIVNDSQMRINNDAHTSAWNTLEDTQLWVQATQSCVMGVRVPHESD